MFLSLIHIFFPHHECEIAQSVASQGDDMVHYWMHNNMITINGTKMGKSLGNFIIALSEVASALNENDIETEIVFIGTKAVQGCIACNKCAELGRCVMAGIRRDATVYA